VIDAIAHHARESDRLTAAIRAHVSATFVTAIEREDALTLSAALDDLVRGAHAVAALLAVYQVEAVRPQARRVTQLIAGNAKALAAAIEPLHHAGDVVPHTDEVRTRAGEGENLARAGLAELFSEDPAPIELVRWKDLFERLQGALDASRHAAITLDVIAAKQR
jgi:uncharacterized protein Yka (UPF0111/DUF47 family)